MSKYFILWKKDPEFANLWLAKEKKRKTFFGKLLDFFTFNYFRNQAYAKAMNIFAESIERHVTISEEFHGIPLWKKELEVVKGTSYGKILQNDIKMAEECNKRQDYCWVFKTKPKFKALFAGW